MMRTKRRRRPLLSHRIFRPYVLMVVTTLFLAGAEWELWTTPEWWSVRGLPLDGVLEIAAALFLAWLVVVACVVLFVPRDKL